jgi:hypothetical protein
MSICPDIVGGEKKVAAARFPCWIYDENNVCMLR